VKGDILIIDDERVFPSLERVFHVTYARTSADAIALLASDTVWREVWFDHDLGPGDDAMRVLVFMANVHDVAPGVWRRRIERAFVHSMNPVGAANIRSRVKDFGIVTRRIPLPEGHSTIHAT